jgi:hypothetical protein
VTSNSITAVYNGIEQTHSVRTWAAIKNVSVKYLQQRKRAGFTDDETINLPYGKSPKKRTIFEKKWTRAQPHWRSFLFAGTGRETYRFMEHS